MTIGNATVTKDAWLNVTTDQSLAADTNYRLQNLSDAAVYITEGTTTPDENTAYGAILPGGWVYTNTPSGESVYLRAQSSKGATVYINQ